MTFRAASRSSRPHASASESSCVTPETFLRIVSNLPKQMSLSPKRIFVSAGGFGTVSPFLSMTKTNTSAFLNPDSRRVLFVWGYPPRSQAATHHSFQLPPKVPRRIPALRVPALQPRIGEFLSRCAPKIISTDAMRRRWGFPVINSASFVVKPVAVKQESA